MTISKNTTIQGKHGKPILLDVFFIETKTPKPIIIFCHGYKGFKDWGAWDLMAKAFAEAGFFFVKFNFSHNGSTEDQPIDFPDLEAFGNNNYTKELDDLETVMDWIYTNPEFKKEAKINNLTLIGHSRGGGIATIKADEDTRVKKVISLAGVSDFKVRMGTESEITAWKEEGVKYVLNGRTKQQMPHYYQFYEDFIKHETRLTIKRAVSNLKTPHLIIHGDSDTSVILEEAKNLHEWNPESTLKIIENADHVFGASHPWGKNHLPQQLKTTIDLCVSFLKNNPPKQ